MRSLLGCPIVLKLLPLSQPPLSARAVAPTAARIKTNVFQRDAGDVAQRYQIYWILLKKSPFSRFRLSRCNNDSIIEQKLDQLIADKWAHERIFLENFACRVFQHNR
jgi:hypothetical protein